MSIGTAFDPRTAPLNEKHAWQDWWGYHTPVSYADSIDIEYNAVRENAGVIDVSPLFKYLIEGPAAEPNYRWIRMNASGLDVSIRDITTEIGALALQGKRSRDVLERATGEDWSGLKYFRRRVTTIGGMPVDVTRTGYTGDLGYELWVDAGRAVDLWDALFEAGRGFQLRPVGNAAMDVLRVEAGLILVDAEFTGVRNAFSEEQEFSPFELGLGRLVNLDKRAFVGKQALAAEQAAGGRRRRLVGMEFDWDGIERAFDKHGIPTVLYLGTSEEPIPAYAHGRQVGKATSWTWSPNLKKVISLGIVSKELAEPGSRLEVEWTVQGVHETVGATVVELPFFDPPRKRA